MKIKSFVRLSLVLAVTLLGSACSRELPSTWPTSSPASPSAAELAPATVTLAVDEDPPLPGEAAEGWFGLERSAGAEPPAHHEHAQHHDQAAPSSEPAPSSKEGGHDH